MASTKKGGLRVKFAWLVFILALALPLWFIAAALGSKYGHWGWQFGLGTMTIQLGPMLILGVGIAAVVSLVLGLVKSPRVKPFILSIAALIIVGLIFGRIANMGSVSENVPPIHDVQTDWEDPIQFSEAIMTEREKVDGVNPVEDDPVIAEYAKSRWPDMAGRSVAEVQRESYQPMNTYIAPAPPDVLYAAAYSSLADLGIEIITADEENYVLEGTYTSQWFGFKDDVAVRIRPKGEGSEMDVRSVSRVGLSDLGANAERVYAILEGVRARIGTPPEE